MLKKTLCAALLCQVTGVGFACTLPPLVVIPAREDAVGQEEQIRAATAAYFEAMQVYTQCVQAELVAAGDAAPTIVKAALVQRNNLAVAEAQAVQKAFTANIDTLEQSGPPPGPAPGTPPAAN